MTNIYIEWWKLAYVNNWNFDHATYLKDQKEAAIAAIRDAKHDNNKLASQMRLQRVGENFRCQHQENNQRTHGRDDLIRNILSENMTWSDPLTSASRCG